ncbi:MAG: hypothetical protein CM1200mP18_19130 [Gammaproteobacteria bacterium]|nr:MAG: hypothetical protein CM1200mP18_19130 [Gammaproteobacteria bacterium]
MTLWVTKQKRKLRGFICEHSLMYSRGQLGFTEFTEEEQQTFAPVRQVLVRTHPVTMRKSLFLASHAGILSVGRWLRRVYFCGSDRICDPAAICLCTPLAIT